MKIKVFAAFDIRYVEEQVNSWLRTQPNVIPVHFMQSESFRNCGDIHFTITIVYQNEPSNH